MWTFILLACTATILSSPSTVSFTAERSVNRCSSSTTLDILQQNTPEQCWVRIGDLLAEDPDCFSLYRDWILLARWTSRLEETTNRLIELEHLFPDQPAIHFARAVTYLLGDSGEETEETSRALLYRARELLDGDDDEGEGYCLLALGSLELYFARAAKAEAILEQSASSFNACGNPAGQGLALNQLAQAHLYQNRFEEGLETSLQALQLFSEQDAIGGSVACLYLMGYFYYYLGNPVEAEKAYRRSLETARSQGDSEYQILDLCWLAMLCEDDRKGQSALTILRQYLDLAESIGDEKRQSDALLNMGNVCTDLLGQYQEALRHYERSLELANQSHYWSNSAGCLAAIGNLYTRLGDYDRARRYHNRAMATINETGIEDPQLTCLIHKEQGYIDYKLDNFQHALESLGKAETIERRTDDAWGLTNTLEMTGLVKLLLADHRGAFAVLDEALSLYTRLEDEHGQARVQFAMAKAHQDLGAVEEAEKAFRLAAEAGHRLSAPLVAWESEYCLALLNREAGRYEQSEACFKRALSVINETRDWLEEDRLKWLYMENKHEVYVQYVALLEQIRGDGARTDIPGTCFLVAEQAHARALLDLLRRARVREREGDELRDTVSPDVCSVTRIQQALPPEDCLLEYLLGAEDSYLLAVCRDQIKIHRLPARAEIESAAETFLNLLEMPTGCACLAVLPELYEASKTLYDMLVSPVMSGLPNRVDHLVIVADGILNYLPFEALATCPDQGVGQPQYLLERYRVSYAHSASVLMEVVEKQPLPDSPERLDLLAIGDPVFPVSLTAATHRGDNTPDSSTGLPLPRLSHTSREVTRIARRLRRARVYTRDEAKASLLRDSAFAGRFRVIHLATHAVVDEQDPDRSIVVLADDRSASDDGLLSMAEIFDLRLSAELVVLSSCNTGRGKRVGGEGVIGISRAFFNAGAQSILHSLWPVEDRFTADFMLDFYDALAQGVSKTEALRMAKLACLTHPERCHPHYWSSFVLMGEYRNSLAFARRSRLGLLLVVIFSAVASLLIISYILLRTRKRS